MRYNRQESLRYTFATPLPAYFQIINVDGKVVTSSEGAANIIDISLAGAKINSKLNIPEIKHKHIELSLRFNLNDNELNYHGTFIWKKEKGETNDYGIQIDLDDEAKKDLIEQLKMFSKKYHRQ
jgi:hypothetical protein